MRIAGYSLILISFLGTSLNTVLHPVSVNWIVFCAFLSLGVVGLIFIARDRHQQARHSEKLDGHINDMSLYLQNIVNNLQNLDKHKSTLPTYDVRFEIDRLFRQDLNNFADVRKSMLYVFGMQKYADVMSAFAAGERYINRIWSASTDGYEDEVREYISRAFAQFKEANRLFEQAKTTAG